MLNVDELKAVLSHEIFHIKNDLVYTPSYLMFKDLLLRPVNLALVSIVGLVIGGISVPAINASLSTELFLLLMLGPELAFLIIFVLLVAHRLFGIMKPGSLSSIKHLFFREFLADANTVIALNDSLSLRNAIIKIARLNLGKQIKSHLLSLVKASTFGNFSSQEIPQFSLSRYPFVEGLTVFSRLKASPKEVEDTMLTNRVSIIDFVGHLMSGNVEIEINNDGQLHLGRTALSVTPEAMASVLANNKMSIPKIITALRSTSKVNLALDAVRFGVSQFDFFVILFFLHNRDIVRFRLS